jgi:hypothetical protein
MHLNRINRDTEIIGKAIATILNDERGELAGWLIDAIGTLSSGSMAQRSFDLVRVADEDVVAIEKLYAPIHFHIYPRGVLRNGEWLGSMLPVDRSRKGNLARDLWTLAAIGAIPRFRRCQYAECQKWFFATRESQRYCSGKKCIENDRRSSDAYKQEQNRRVKMHYYVHGDGKKSQTKVARKWRREWEKAHGRKAR